MMSVNQNVSDEYLTEITHQVAEDLKNTSLYSSLQKAARFEISKPTMKVSDMRTNVVSALSNTGWDRQLRNEIYCQIQKVQSTPHPASSQEHQKEPLEFLRKAQLTWEKRVTKSLNSMCTELNVTLARRRPEKAEKDMLLKWGELGADVGNIDQFRPVYAPKDFLEVLAGIRNLNAVHSDCPGYSNFWGLIQVNLHVKDIHELRIHYSDISINQSQVGIDDASEFHPELFEQERIKHAKQVLSTKNSALAQAFARKGCPVGSRAGFWQLILNIYVTDEDRLYYEQLKCNVLKHELLADTLIFKDVKLTATNDDQYFVFEDYIYQILLPFSRDTVVLDHVMKNASTPPKAYLRGKLGEPGYSVNYPPNGIIPFHGFSMYVAPLCYIYNDPITLYYIFRELYIRYFHQLHIISSHPNGILSLSLLFECLLQTHEPELFLHLRKINAPPLKIAFKWIIRAFSGYLASEEVLLLWDRVLSFGSTDILSVLAYGIFMFRKTNLMQVESYASAEAVLADLTTLKVIPLLQLCLFSE